MCDGVYRVTVAKKSGFQLVDYEAISPGDNQRKLFPDLELLADQIEESGWVQTLMVKPDGTLIQGERRWRAVGIVRKRALAKGLKDPWPKLPCIIVDATERGSFDLNVNENLGRAELRFIELARIFKAYREVYGLSNEEIGKRCGYRAENVSKYISIIEKCHPDIIARLDNGEEIQPSFLMKIYNIRDKEVQKLRLEQWLGNPTEATNVSPAKQRGAKLSRRKMLQVVQVLQEANMPEETIQVAQYLAGLRQTLPNKLHLRLSQSRRPRQPASQEKH